MKRIAVLFLLFVLMLGSGCGPQLALKWFKPKDKPVVIVDEQQKSVENIAAGIVVETVESSVEIERMVLPGSMEAIDAEVAELLGIMELSTSEAATEEVALLISWPDVYELPESIPEGDKKVFSHMDRYKFEVGGAAGVFGAATALGAEVRFPLRYVFGPAATSLRFAVAYAQSKDTARRYLPIHIDAMLNYPPGVATGVENYFGAGLNYSLLTSGGSSGSFGGEIFYGVESAGFGGKLFAEMGYGILCAGLSSSHKGVTLLVGYRREWAL